MLMPSPPQTILLDGVDITTGCLEYNVEAGWARVELRDPLGHLMTTEKNGRTVVAWVLKYGKIEVDPPPPPPPRPNPPFKGKEYSL